MTIFAAPAINMITEGKKGKGVRLYIFEDDEPRLKELCERTGLTNTTALSMVISAGLKALGENDYSVTLPLKFKVATGTDPASKPSRK